MKESKSMYFANFLPRDREETQLSQCQGPGISWCVDRAPPTLSKMFLDNAFNLLQVCPETILKEHIARRYEAGV